MNTLRIILATLLIVGSVDAQVLLYGKRTAPAAAPSGITADLHQTFEVTYPDTNSLSSVDGTSIGSWTTNGTVMLSTGAEFPLGTTVNGNGDSGHTNGFIRVFGTTGITNITYDIGSANAKAAVSFRFNWKYSGSPGINKRIFVALANSGSDYPRLDLNYSTRYVQFSGLVNSNGAALNADTWYRFHIQYNQNATCYARVYDTNGVQVGSEITETAVNSPWRYFLLSHYNAELGDGSVVFHWDDIIADWTTATYPLGP